MLLLHHISLGHEVVDLLEVRGVVQSLYDLHRPLARSLADGVKENLCSVGGEVHNRMEQKNGGIRIPS